MTPPLPSPDKPTAGEATPSSIVTAPALPPQIFDLVAARFPLVPRFKPVCGSLNARIERVRALAREASLNTDEAPLRAAEAYNLAALIASDCGMNELARHLCWRQYENVQRRRHLPAATAKLTLQPMINMGRLLIREGDGDGAYQLFTALFDAAKARGPATIGRRTVDLTDLTEEGAEHQQLIRWLWTVMLADATRALARAGRWSNAFDHVQRHRGLGRRLLDGRQVAILAQYAQGDLDTAARLLADTNTTESWEHSAAACLGLLVEHANGRRPAEPDCAAAVGALLGLAPEPENRAFRVALALCLADLTADSRWPGTLLRWVSDLVRDDGDAYAARDLFAHPRSRTYLDDEALTGLNATIRRAALGHGTIPEPLLTDLQQSLDIAESALATQANQRI